MRISDWSSDVCSSDLMRFGVEQFLGRFAIDQRVIFIADRIRLDDHLALLRRHRSAAGAGRLDEGALDGGWRSIGKRPEERRVGKECVSKGSSRWAPDH